MIKRVITKLLAATGYSLVKIRPASEGKSTRTDHLSFYDTATGKYFLPTDAKNDIVANTIINNDIFEKDVVDLASEFIKPGTTVLDVGSNFGQMTVLFSKMLGDKGTVHCFDADDWVFQILKKNIEANGLTARVVPHFGAVHNVDGERMFFPEQDFKEFGAYGSYGIDYNSKKGREVTSFTIDSLEIDSPVSFMKIDIQGGDLQAMQGATRLIEKNKMPILFEYEYHFETRFNMSFQDYVDFVKKIGYKFSRVVNGHNFLIVPA